MKIAVASDHGGFALKELVKKHLEQRNLEVLDLGHPLRGVGGLPGLRQTLRGGGRFR